MYSIALTCCTVLKAGTQSVAPVVRHAVYPIYEQTNQEYAVTGSHSVLELALSQVVSASTASSVQL